MAKPKKPKRKGPGRPPYQPDEATRGEVRALVIVGYGEQFIADYLGIDKKTLTKHFGDIIRRAKPRFIGAVAQSIGQLALGRPAEYDAQTGQLRRKELEPDTGACCFILKTQARHLGWAERQEHSGPDGAAIPLRLETLSDAQLDALIKRLQPGEGSR